MQTKVQPKFIAVLLVGVLAFATALLTSSPFATAQSAWQGGQVEGLPSSESTSNDISGTSISNTAVLYTVDNRLQTLGIYTPGSVGYIEEDTIDLSSVSGYDLEDVESVTWMSNSPERIAVVDERDNTLYIMELNNGSASVVQRVPLASQLPVSWNKAIEGLAFSHDESTAAANVFYVGVEGTGDMHRLVIPTSGTSFGITSFDLGIPEAAGLAIIQGTNEIYVVSETNNMLYSTDTSGSTPQPIMMLQQFTQPEGVAVHPNGTEMYIVGEAGSTHDREISRWTRTLPVPTPTPSPTPPPSSTPPPLPTPLPTPIPTPQPNPIPEGQPLPWNAGNHTVGIAAGNDDVEEALGWINTTSGDLDANASTIIGLRFTEVCVADSTDLVSAYLSLTADEDDSNETIATINGESVGDSAPFDASNLLSQRAQTAASRTWDVNNWTAGAVSQSPNITAVVAEIVSRPDWEPCNDISLFIRATGDREAVSFETDPSRAPRLILNTNGFGSFDNSGAPSTGTNTVEAFVTTGSNDVEERLTRMIHSSGDLDVSNGYVSGLRYKICVPQGAIINQATVSFVADEADTTPTTFTFTAQASGDAEPFNFDPSNLSLRPTTATNVVWNVPAWEAGGPSVSDNLSPIIAEVTSRSDWTGCGHIVVVMTSTGDREAVSWETNSALAPRLSVTWTA